MNQIARSIRLTISYLLTHISTMDSVAKRNGMVLLFGEVNGTLIARRWNRLILFSLSSTSASGDSTLIHFTK